jgi:hypothetical protein
MLRKLFNFGDQRLDEQIQQIVDEHNRVGVGSFAKHIKEPSPHSGHEKISRKGQANGYAGLDGDGKIALVVIPLVGKGKILAGGAASAGVFGPGADGQIIYFDSTQPLGLRAGDPPAGGALGEIDGGAPDTVYFIDEIDCGGVS